MAITRRQWLTVGLCVPLTLAAGAQSAVSGSASGARTALTLLVGAAPGGGWDTVARELQVAMRENNIVANPQVINVPGAAGTIALEQLMQMKGQTDVVMVTGTVMLGGIDVNDSLHDLTETTAIAHLADDYEAIVVPTDSPLESLDDLIRALKDDPGAVSFGGGSLGGTDHLLAGMLAQEVEVDPTEINYVPFAGGGEAVSALLSHSVTAGVSGYNEFADQVTAGNLRLLGIASPERMDGADGPTFAEAGYETYLPNWRGVVAPPGLTDDDSAELTAIISETVATPEWADALKRNKWIDAYQDGREFKSFVGAETQRVEAIIEGLGL
ncbi:Bug family tripartite tricarboxylate transporter substrate binding protein [Brevibacterium marinum]|uniref:Putative tricarboxylic transport membrane protein n=1 Tax=Brevibacterium marinum TaxID=418643 RepID=A0A846RQS5_9MICO|nr:tripartite tricarboxylate transporter substrate-binding protein [Brevibacterium marinum]NJC56324.1 putative tricarboxylic transport membrane protein [Brevibacterium marinum]